MQAKDATSAWRSQRVSENRRRKGTVCVLPGANMGISRGFVDSREGTHTHGSLLDRGVSKCRRSPAGHRDLVVSTSVSATALSLDRPRAERPAALLLLCSSQRLNGTGRVSVTTGSGLPST